MWKAFKTFDINIQRIWPFLESLEFFMLSCHHRCGAFVAGKPDLKVVPGASLLAEEKNIASHAYGPNSQVFFTVQIGISNLLNFSLDLVWSSKIQWNRNHELQCNCSSILTLIPLDLQKSTVRLLKNRRSHVKLCPDSFQHQRGERLQKTRRKVEQGEPACGAYGVTVEDRNP